MFLIGLAEGVEQNRRTREGCIMYYTILVIHLLPVTPQFLGNMFLIGLAESVEQNRRTQERLFVDKANKFFHTFSR